MAEQQGAHFTSEQVKDMLKELVHEMKKPTILEQKKLDEDEAQKAKLNRMRLDAAKRAIEVEEGKKANCPHKNPHGKHTFVAQVNSDGYFRPLCQICHSSFAPIRASDYQKMNGVNLHLYQPLTPHMLAEWAKSSQGELSVA